MNCFFDATVREDWQQTFAAMSLFGALILIAAIPLQYLERGVVFAAMRNCGIIFIAASMPAYAWQSVQRRTLESSLGAAVQHAVLLFANVAVAMCGLLMLRLLATRQSAAACLRLLDFAAGLIVPMCSGIGIVMLPYLSRIVMRRVTQFLAVCSLLAALGLAMSYAGISGGRSKGTTTAPVRRPASTLTAVC